MHMRSGEQCAAWKVLRVSLVKPGLWRSIDTVGLTLPA